MTRPRRSGISYVENDSNRSITFFKRRAGLYKAAADLSTLTGARIAMALESETGKMSTFGTPSAGPIIDSFLSGNIPVDPSVNEEKNGEITLLQNEVFMAEKEKYMEDRRKQETSARAKEIQETSRKAKLVYGKVEDLSVEELNEMVHDLSQIEQEINDGRHPQQPSYIETAILAPSKIIMVSSTTIKVTILSSQSFLAAISTSTAKATVPTQFDAAAPFGGGATGTNDAITY
ncbi:hypothetical protein C2845_PM04G02140 [Panicum miliaceum]|uniref:MADS-box domain-containing protein n=1 Tax=Panicum miliaceum TaxID=4540 RepID=A0A3L6QLA7_PANMI|nr:hypothetical protein C2845_PM04G02140 [Panicum miliaceum]